MLGIIIGIIFLLVKLATAYEKKRAAMLNALCHGCVHVHKVKGFSGKVQLSCNFGSELRPLKFAVRECTGFCSSCAPPPAPVRVAGFIRLEELSGEEAFPATVIRISR